MKKWHKDKNVTPEKRTCPNKENAHTHTHTHTYTHTHAHTHAHTHTHTHIPLKLMMCPCFKLQLISRLPPCDEPVVEGAVDLWGLAL